MGRSTIEFRLILTLAVIALVAVAGVLMILPYRLYERDIRNAASDATRISSVVQAALTCPLDAGLDAGELVGRIQNAGGMQIALSRLEAGEIEPGAVAGRGSGVLDDTDLRYVSTPVIDPEGKAWVAEMHFDLSPMKRESVRLIIDLVLAVTIGALIFSIAIFWLFRGAFIKPVRELTRRVERLASGDSVEMPHFESREMSDLAEAIERVARAR